MCQREEEEEAMSYQFACSGPAEGPQMEEDREGELIKQEIVRHQGSEQQPFWKRLTASNGSRSHGDGATRESREGKGARWRRRWCRAVSALAVAGRRWSPGRRWWRKTSFGGR